MHKLAIPAEVLVALMLVKLPIANALDWPGVIAASVAIVVAPLRNVMVSEAAPSESLVTTPDAATGVGLGPNKVLPAVTLKFCWGKQVLSIGF